MANQKPSTPPPSNTEPTSPKDPQESPPTATPPTGATDDLAYLYAELCAKNEAVSAELEEANAKLEASRTEMARVEDLCLRQQNELAMFTGAGTSLGEGRPLALTSHPFIRRATWRDSSEENPTDIIEIGHEEGHILHEESSYSHDVLMSRIVGAARRAADFIAAEPLPVYYDQDVYDGDRTNYIRVSVVMYSGEKLTDADIATAQAKYNAG